MKLSICAQPRRATKRALRFYPALSHQCKFDLENVNNVRAIERTNKNGPERTEHIPADGSHVICLNATGW